MPNGIRNINIEMAQPFIQPGVAAIGGGAQRAAWEFNIPAGFVTTGIFLIGGTLVSFMTDGLPKVIAMGAADSGASVAGWLLTEQFLLGAPAKGAESRGRMRRREMGGGGSQEALNAGKNGARSRSNATATSMAA